MPLFSFFSYFSFEFEKNHPLRTFSLQKNKKELLPFILAKKVRSQAD